VGRFSVGEPAEVFKRFDSAPEVEPLEGLAVKGGGRLGEAVPDGEWLGILLLAAWRPASWAALA